MVLYLLSSAIPVAAPATSHQRGSAPFTTRSTASAASGQAHSPISSVETFIPKLISTGARNTTSAASPCAKRPPPSSRASAHAT